MGALDHHHLTIFQSETTQTPPQSDKRDLSSSSSATTKMPLNSAIIGLSKSDEGEIVENEG
jgi:hypothetical protein